MALVKASSPPITKEMALSPTAEPLPEPLSPLFSCSSTHELAPDNSARSAKKEIAFLIGIINNPAREKRCHEAPDTKYVV